MIILYFDFITGIIIIIIVIYYYFIYYLPRLFPYLALTNFTLGSAVSIYRSPSMSW